MAGGVGQVFDCMRSKRGLMPSMATYLYEILTYNGPFAVAVARSQREAHLPLAASVIELATEASVGVTSASNMGRRSARSDGVSSRAHTDTSAHPAANRGT